MARPPVIADLRAALLARTFPTVTVWNRLEGRPRSVEFDRALSAEVRDALWMLAAVFTWSPVVGAILRAVAIAITWVGATVGLGAAIVSPAALSIVMRWAGAR